MTREEAERLLDLHCEMAETKRWYALEDNESVVDRMVELNLDRGVAEALLFKHATFAAIKARDGR